MKTCSVVLTFVSIMETCSVVRTFESIMETCSVARTFDYGMKPLQQYFCMVPVVFNILQNEIWDFS